MGKYRCNRCTEEWFSKEKGRVEDCPFCGGMGTVKKIGTKVSMKEITGKFREGQASHFNSLIEKWAKKHGLKVDWKFREGRGRWDKGKTLSYFVITGKDYYKEWGSDAQIELNGLVHSFNVDYRVAGNSVIVE